VQHPLTPSFPFGKLRAGGKRGNAEKNPETLDFKKSYNKVRQI